MSTQRALLLAAALLAPSCGERVGAHEFSSDVEHCKANLREVYAGLRAYADREGHPPTGSGVAFFAELVTSGVWPRDEAHARLLTCPGVAPEELGLPASPADWFPSLEALGPDSSAYAGRDSERAPLPSFPGPGTEALMACDNQRGANHAGITNVLMADGSVLSLELATEQAAGRVPPGAERITVGPDSPLRELRALSADR